MRLVDHVFDDQVIDEVVTRIILPEGSKYVHSLTIIVIKITDLLFFVRNVVLKSPYPVQQEEISRHYTYLDVMGRPVVTVRASNLVEDHIADFEVSII